MLRGMRVKAGMSQEKLARKAGVTTRAVQKWESNGTQRAQLGCMKRVADVLQCRIEDLL